MEKRAAALILIFAVLLGCISDEMCLYGDNDNSVYTDDNGKQKPEIFLSCEGESGKNGYYIGMVKVSVDIRNFDIEQIADKEYVIQCGNNITSKKLEKDTFNITQNGEKMNVYVRIKDYDGNIYTSRKLTFSVHMERPCVSVQKIDSDTVDIEVCEKYADENMVIDDVKKYLDIKISATGYPGTDIDYEEPVIEWSERENNVYLARVRIVSDGIYSLIAVYDNGINDAVEESIEWVSDSEPPDEDMVCVNVYKYDKDGHRCGKSISHGFGHNTDKTVYTDGHYEMKISGYKDCDLVSGVDAAGAAGVCYYVTDKILNISEVREISKWDEYSDGYAVKIDSKRFRIYVKLTDREGNVSYASTGEYAVDDTAPYIGDIETVSQPNENGFFNKNVIIKVEADDRGKLSSGMKKVEYNIECNGKLMTEWKQTETYSEGQYGIELPAEAYNGVVHINVRATDRAGNISFSKSRKIKIDTVSPDIHVKYDNNDVRNKSSDGSGYYNRKRTAMITVTEENFDKTNALDYMDILFKKEKDREYRKISVNEMHHGKWKDNGNIHSIEIKFDEDGYYIFKPAYTDKAGNVNKDVIYDMAETPEEFVIDTVKPDALIMVKDKEWIFKGLSRSLKYNRFSSRSLNTDIEAADRTSGIKNVSYCIVNSDYDIYENIEDMEWQNYMGTIEIITRGNKAVYARAEDYAGNVRYAGTNGMIIDDMAPEINISAENEQDVYNSDVRINVNVKELKQNNSFSGIRSVRYEVCNMGNITRHGVLYDSTAAEHDFNDDFNGQIWVNSKENNSNEVLVVIYAQDNAGNESVEEKHIKIDITPPEIDIKYDNNDGTLSDDGRVYFKSNRTAVIEVRERNPDISKINIDISSAEGAAPRISEWRKKDGSGNMDDAVLVAEVFFECDGDYTMNVSCSDEAGNLSKTDYKDSVSPVNFIIDKSAEPVKIEYDNNTVHNGVYYDKPRTADIIINEKNFDISKVNIDISVMRNGDTEVYKSEIKWSHNNEVHSATVRFEDDGYYTVKVSYIDKAGNESSSGETESFWIDRTMPEVTVDGITDKSANRSGNIGLNVKITDSNLDFAKAVLTALVRENGAYRIINAEPSVTRTATGFEYVYNNLEEDGIYTLECNAADKADNIYINNNTGSGKVLTFTVNRNGSVFYLSDYAMGLSEKYYIKSVDRDIVISEINADEINNNIVKVNGKVLQKNTEYTVERPDNGGAWNRYEYTIKKSIFEEDMEYMITVQSEDASGGVSYSDMKDMKLAFVVDTKRPEVSVSGIREDGIYNAKTKKVSVRVRDDGGKVKSFLAELNDSGKVLFDMEGDELDKYLADNKGIITFNIPETVGEDLYIRCSDSSIDEEGKNNVSESMYRNITVSQNRFVLFYKNKFLFYGSVATAMVIMAVSVYIIARKIQKGINKKA